MLGLLGAFCVMFVFLGGAWFQTEPVLGMLAAAAGTTTLGCLMAFVQMGHREYISGSPHLATDDLFLQTAPMMPPCRVGVQTATGITYADHVFICQYDGEQVFVIAAADSGGKEA